MYCRFTSVTGEISQEISVLVVCGKPYIPLSWSYSFLSVSKCIRRLRNIWITEPVWYASSILLEFFTHESHLLTLTFLSNMRIFLNGFWVYDTRQSGRLLLNNDVVNTKLNTNLDNHSVPWLYHVFMDSTGSLTMPQRFWPISSIPRPRD